MTVERKITFLSHGLAILVSAGAITLAWVGLTLPIVAVFLIDKEFDTGDYAKFVAAAAGISLGISWVILFPLAFLLERLTKRLRPFTLAAFAVPVALFIVSGLVLAVDYLVFTRSILETVLYRAPGRIFVFSVSFGIYWLVFLPARTVMRHAHRLRKSSGVE